MIVYKQFLTQILKDNFPDKGDRDINFILNSALDEFTALHKQEPVSFKDFIEIFRLIDGTSELTDKILASNEPIEKFLNRE